MGNSIIDETFQVYVQMRTGGKDAKATLDALRMRIEVMNSADRAEMVRRVKMWESGSQKGNNSKAVKPIAGRPAARDAKKSAVMQLRDFVSAAGCKTLRVSCFARAAAISSAAKPAHTKPFASTTLMGHDPPITSGMIRRCCCPFPPRTLPTRSSLNATNTKR